MNEEILLRGLSKEEKEKVISSFNAANVILRRINELLLKEIKKASSPSNLVDINSENYIYKRIWKDGYAKGLTKLLDYVKIKE